MRRRLFTLHRYAGLAAGAFIVILGVTGSIMAFEEQLDHVFHPRLFHVSPQAHAFDVSPQAHAFDKSPQAPSRSLAELGAAASTIFPGERVVAYGMSVSADLSYFVGFRSGTVWVNQYTGEVLGTRHGPTFLSNVHQLHLRLLAGDTGKMIVSWAGLVMVFLLVSGLCLWWPTKRFTIAWNASAARVWFDVHNAAGILSLLFLLLLTITGVIIGFETVTTPMFYALTSSEPLRASFETEPRTGVTAKTPDEAVAIARAALPGAAPISVNVPGPKAVYRVALRYPEDLTPGGRSRVYVEPYTGAVLQAESSRTTAGGTRAVILNRAIHTGDIFGTPSKAVMSLASLMAALQVVSGAVLWWKRRRT